MNAFNTTFDRQLTPLTFFNACSPVWKEIFPLVYVVPKDLILDSSLFDDHAVLSADTAERMRALLYKRKHATQEQNDSQGRARLSSGASFGAGAGDRGASGQANVGN